MAPPSGEAPALVIKILREAEWHAFGLTGSFEGSPDDLRDGFIHLSAPAQVEATLGRHFAGESAVVLLGLKTAALGPDLKWEPSRGGALFPHLYRPLGPGDVERSERAVRRGGLWALPKWASP